MNQTFKEKLALYFKSSHPAIAVAGNDEEHFMKEVQDVVEAMNEKKPVALAQWSITSGLISNDPEFCDKKLKGFASLQTITEFIEKKCITDEKSAVIIIKDFDRFAKENENTLIIHRAWKELKMQCRLF